MSEELAVSRLMLHLPARRAALESFLEHHHLRLDADVESAFGVSDAQGQLLGCGCAAGRVLKCFAVDESLRGRNVLGTLITALTRDRYDAGFFDLFVITRPENRPLFVGCGFYPMAETQSLVMLENRPQGPERFAAPFVQPGDRDAVIGSLVMNCNPFTKGHRALVEYAVARCDAVHLFVVEEDRSAFSFPVRLRLVQDGTADLPKVRVHPSGPYILSSATFPTYFLKSGEDAAVLQSQLDITLFARRIAPALHITRRFAGQEPLDPVTARYNNAMRELLPQWGITFEEIPRLEASGQAVSASRVRRLLAEQGVTPEVLSLVPESTAQYLKTEFKGF